MITLEQIKEIKENTAFLKEHLIKSLFEIILIDEFDLRNLEEITFGQANEIRKRLSRLKPDVSNKFNILISSFEKNLTNKDILKNLNE